MPRTFAVICLVAAVSGAERRSNQTPSLPRELYEIAHDILDDYDTDSDHDDLYDRKNYHPERYDYKPKQFTEAPRFT